MRSLLLRRAQIEDLKEMQNLFVETIKTVCVNDYNPEQIKIWTSSIENTERWLNRIRDQYVLIAEIRGKIAGYGSLRANDYLDLLYVHKDYQRKGIAGLLCDCIEKEAIRRNGTEIQSDVSITARPFFEKKGYTVVKEQKNMIKNVEIVNFKMVKQLNHHKP